MIITLLLAAQGAQLQAYTPKEEQAVVAFMKCEKAYIDAMQPRGYGDSIYN